MIYTNEAFRFKKTRKFGKEEMRIVKDYRNLEVDKPKEREGCRKPVADPYVFCLVGWFCDDACLLEGRSGRSRASLWVRGIWIGPRRWRRECMGVSGEGSTRTKGPRGLSCCECTPMLVYRY